MLLSLFSSTLGWSLARQDISHLKSTRQNQNEEKLIVLTKWTKPRLINWVINGLLVPVSVHTTQHDIWDNNQPDQADNRRKWKWGVLSKKSSWDCCECHQPAWHVGQSCRLPHQARHFQGAKVIIRVVLQTKDVQVSLVKLLILLIMLILNIILILLYTDHTILRDYIERLCKLYWPY